VEAKQVWETIEQVRERQPLVHNITNYVVMHSTANALLAVGASPIMAHAPEEMDDLIQLADALVLNIGTLSGPWIGSMFKAGKAANEKGIPVILDPVGAGASALRTETATKIFKELHPAIIRGNASEIMALWTAEGGARGVDSQHATSEAADAGAALAGDYGAVVSISGETDLVISDNRTTRIQNGDALMGRITGMGCAATAVTGAFAAAVEDRHTAAASAMVLMGIAGELAAESAAGPGTFEARFLDALYAVKEEDITRRARVQES
jgi:hydroxyethylthiazole kinase